MTLDEIKASLVGQTIVAVEADAWDDSRGWLTNAFSVVIHLSNGLVLDTLEEPLLVDFLRIRGG
ncbi:MAG: hypothetical protein ABSG90_13380 [Dehalococcoidia bacterium]|jgi:hypothetical protein